MLRSRIWENSLEEPIWFWEKPIHNITNSNNPSNQMFNVFMYEQDLAWNNQQ